MDFEMAFYDYPVGKQINPFEPIDGENYFVELGRYFSYLGDFEQIGSMTMDERLDIFTGTGGYVVNILKRAALVKNGKVIYRNKKFDDGHILGRSRLDNVQYVIHTSKMQKYKVDLWMWGETPLKTYSIHNDNGNPYDTLQLKLFQTVEEAIEYAIPLSKQQDMTCIISQWFADIDTH